jgi:prepilin-type N-terminal cleavage/methylation domain-containing protein
MAARIRAWLSEEDGMTLPELLTTMAILSVVMTGILVMFVGGLRATTDMNERFQAQQNARIALGNMRNNLGSACSATIGAVPGQATGSLLTLTEPSTSGACASGTTQVSWCADSATHVAPFALYRQASSTCASGTGTLRVRSLTSNVVFATPSGCVTGQVVRPQVAVSLPVDANLASTKGKYTLRDTITLRNATAAAQC